MCTGNSYEAKHKEILLKTFAFVIDVLEKHHLEYYTSSGTTLGAIRHQGMIPWDDDIDIFVPRDDYDWLLSNRDIFNGTDYYLVAPGDGNYYLPHSKICNRNTTIWEESSHPFVCGVFIDIFPLDYFDWPKEQILKEKRREIHVFARYKDCIADHSISRFILLAKKSNWGSFARLLLGFLLSHVIDARVFLNKFLDMQRQLPNNKEGKYCVCTSISAGKVYLTEWFKDYTLMPFEGLQVKVQNGYDEYLKLLYGDYMTPPPVEQRVINHKRYYINLEEGLTIDEVRERIKQGEHQK